jgi:hypothetical protein
MAGSIRGPEIRQTDSDRPVAPAAERSIERSVERLKFDSIPPSPTSTPLPVSEGVVLRSESRLMPPARPTFLSISGVEPDDNTTGDEP